MLMWYGCDHGHVFQVWNSRDGVTPFAIACHICNGGHGLPASWDYLARHLMGLPDERCENAALAAFGVELGCIASVFTGPPDEPKVMEAGEYVVQHPSETRYFRLDEIDAEILGAALAAAAPPLHAPVEIAGDGLPPAPPPGSSRQVMRDYERRTAKFRKKRGYI